MQVVAAALFGNRGGRRFGKDVHHFPGQEIGGLVSWLQGGGRAQRRSTARAGVGVGGRTKGGRGGTAAKFLRGRGMGLLLLLWIGASSADESHGGVSDRITHRGGTHRRRIGVAAAAAVLGVADSFVARQHSAFFAFRDGHLPQQLLVRLWMLLLLMLFLQVSVFLLLFSHPEFFHRGKTRQYQFSFRSRWRRRRRAGISVNVVFLEVTL
mmetsp:Transcript_103123/g.210290  ORF Transcript_103123/g.210290 Transcript_103123/m.210290 type:complete len:210 (-) Transcript_103123:292-921(-)